MNSEVVAASSGKIMHDLVLKVALDEYSNLAEEISEMITEGVGI
jgi:hypothetical protein